MTNYTMKDNQMHEWKQIAKAYAKKVSAELVFVNAESFGIEHKDGTLQHIYIDELIELLSK